MMWWNNLKQYCEEFIALHYTSDELVKGDSELQNMVDEVRHVGGGGGGGWGAGVYCYMRAIL